MRPNMIKNCKHRYLSPDKILSTEHALVALRLLKKSFHQTNCRKKMIKHIVRAALAYGSVGKIWTRSICQLTGQVSTLCQFRTGTGFSVRER